MLRPVENKGVVRDYDIALMGDPRRIEVVAAFIEGALRSLRRREVRLHPLDEAREHWKADAKVMRDAIEFGDTRHFRERRDEGRAETLAHRLIVGRSARGFRKKEALLM